MSEHARPPLRVLILTADVGEGHVAAGRALQESLAAQRGAEAVVQDGLQALGRCARALIRDGYRSQLRSAPWTFNLLYRCWLSVAPLRWIGGRALHRLGRRRLAALVAARRADVVVSTHPALTAALGRMRRRGELDAVLCATITDLVENPMWCHRGTDLHMVMHPTCVDWVQRRTGCGSVVAVRPLVAERFHAPRDVAAARAALELPAQGTLVVVSGGGWGVGALHDGVTAAVDAGADRVVVLAGRNPEAHAALRARWGEDPRVRVLGFTTRMPELLHAATVLVHGTGGMTTLEAIACGCPVIGFGTRLAHVREHNATLARLGLCTVAGDGDELRRALAAQLAAPPATASTAVSRLATLDAGRAVAQASRRVRPRSRRVLGAQRLAAALLCTGGMLWTVATDDAFSLTASPLALRPVTRLRVRDRAIGLVVQAPAPAIAGLARELARSRIHVSFAVRRSLSPAVQATLRRAGDDTIPVLPGSGTVTWLGTLDQLSDLQGPVGSRLLLALPGRLSLGQYLFARSAGYKPLDPRAISSTSGAAARPLPGEVWLVRAPVPAEAALVRRTVARVTAASLSVDSVGALLATRGSRSTVAGA